MAFALVVTEKDGDIYSVSSVDMNIFFLDMSVLADEMNADEISYSIQRVEQIINGDDWDDLSEYRKLTIRGLMLQLKQLQLQALAYDISDAADGIK